MSCDYPRMDKQNRQQKIVDLIQTRRCSTQRELQEDLERVGFRVTQSSLSRDLEELNVIKQNGRYVLPKSQSGLNASGLLSLEPSGDALVVAKSLPGHASAIALEIDRAALPMVVGTIAGDDTIFVAVTEQRSQRAAIKSIWELFAKP